MTGLYILLSGVIVFVLVIGVVDMYQRHQKKPSR